MSREFQHKIVQKFNDESRWKQKQRQSDNDTEKKKKKKEQWIFGHVSNNIAIFTIILILPFLRWNFFFFSCSLFNNSIGSTVTLAATAIISSFNALCTQHTLYAFRSKLIKWIFEMEWHSEIERKMVKLCMYRCDSLFRSRIMINICFVFCVYNVQCMPL